MSDGPTITPPAPTPPAPDPLAEARAMLEAANAAAAAAKAERERLEKLLADSKQAAQTPPAPAPPAQPQIDPADFAAIRERLEHQRRDLIVERVRGMGLQSEWPRERILALAPDVDPNTEAGKLALEKFREANKDLFRQPEPSYESILQERIKAATSRPEGVKEHPIFTDRYIAGVYQANLTERAQ